jgi:hypothetical protein
MKSMSLKHIRLELARTHEFPQGSSDCGYLLLAPLTAEGLLDRDAWPAAKARCTVQRFWQGEADRTGRLLHRGHGWYFHYEDSDGVDEEPVFKLDRHSFNVGDYVSVVEEEGGEPQPFRVVQVTG